MGFPCLDYVDTFTSATGMPQRHLDQTFSAGDSPPDAIEEKFAVSKNVTRRPKLSSSITVSLAYTWPGLRAARGR
jgi:hypothetical protein